MRAILQQGGPVLWLILICGLTAVVVFLERAFHLHRAGIKSEDFLKGIVNILRKKNIDEALAICDETPGPVARVVKTAIQNRASRREQLDTAINDAGLSEISRLEARIGLIAVISQIAPLLGLLGTVLGLMTLLRDFQSSQWQSARVTAGLWRALITSAAGLTVAIPCFAFYGLLVSKIESLVVDMERAASEIVAFITGQE